MSGMIAHEWIARHGGSENVADQFAAMFPDADIFTLWKESNRLDGHRVSESRLARSALRKSKALALPFMAQAWRSVNVSSYDWVLASSHVFAHHVGGRAASTPRFVYVHTPLRMIWAPDQDSRGANIFVRSVSPLFRFLDRRATDHDTRYAANSNFIKDRISRAWGKTSSVIYPPVEVLSTSDIEQQLTADERVLLDELPRGYVLGASRFVPYKRLDLVMRAADESGMPAVIAGSGPHEKHLRGLAQKVNVPVVFVSAPSNALLSEIYRRAAVFVFPAIEDFGIMPVEAMALGTPVVVAPTGGARESVEIAGGGIVCESLSPQAIAAAIREAVLLNMASVPEIVEERFGTARFRQEILAWMDHAIDGRD
jgi:glycosyltransferase involved in cell wall biosynthesis